MMISEMPAEAAVDLLRLFEDAGIDVWLDGGWAVDAALGEQTRAHKDLDIIVQISDLPRLRTVIGAQGFGIKEGGTESNFVLADNNGLEVDVHAFFFDETGNGVYRMSNGEAWVFPARGFAGRGQILDFNVRCLSPEVQVLCHAHGYVPKEKDLRDMELLEARFGVELPSHLRRQT
ncbi:MAG TPA: nucleotidyltransferase family protein [Pyrinomonadaceae bacterium]